MSNGQKLKFSFFLWQKPEQATEWITFDEWKKIEPQLDYGTAKDVLATFDQRNYEIAIKQLRYFL